MGRSHRQIRSAVINRVLHVCNTKPRPSPKEIRMSFEAVFDSVMCLKAKAQYAMPCALSRLNPVTLPSRNVAIKCPQVNLNCEAPWWPRDSRGQIVAPTLINNDEHMA